MAKIELTRKNAREHQDFEPVDLGGGIVLDALMDKDGDMLNIEIEVSKNGRNVGRMAMNDERATLFVNLNTDTLTRNEKRSIMEAMTDMLLNLAPEQ